jgi:hypothetical protein
MSSDENVLDFPKVEVTLEKKARRVMVEATRLANLAPGEWRLWIDRSAERLSIPRGTLEDLIVAIIRDTEKKAREAKAEARRQGLAARREQEREQREQRREQERIDKETERKCRTLARSGRDSGAPLPFRQFSEPGLMLIARQTDQGLVPGPHRVRGRSGRRS